jgi:beta-lactamase superfamily II metal-dependent hydrolase
LLTGDAGNNALWWAAQHAKAAGLTLQNFTFVQVPHHGSRRNVGPSVLNELLGPIQPKDTVRFSAFVSAPAKDDSHPRKIVLNAFMRRGGKVVATQGQNKVHWGGFPPRPGYGDVPPLTFSTSVEAYD